MTQKLKTIKTINAPKRSVGRPRKVEPDALEDEDDINQWGDASSYAANMFGDVAYNTNRFDTDWN